MNDLNGQFPNDVNNGPNGEPVVPEDRPEVFTPPMAPVADMPDPASAEPQPYRADTPQQLDMSASEEISGLFDDTAGNADAEPIPVEPSQFEIREENFAALLSEIGREEEGTEKNAAEKAAPLTMPVQGLASVEIEPPTRKEKRGVKVFAVVLALVLVLTAGMGAGYILGRGGLTDSGRLSAPDVQLEKKPEDAAENTIESIYKVVSPSIVKIYVYNDSGYSQSSGVIYSSDGYIVTNDHIYEGIAAPNIVVELKDGTQYEAKFIAGDSRSDLSVIKIDADGLAAAVFGDSDALVVGETVIAIGNPDNAEVATATSGIVSAVDTWVSGSSKSGNNYSSRLIQTDAALNPGSSGGALVNAYGQVVGITSSKIISTDYDLINYAIPTTVMRRVVESLIKDGYVTGRAKLGITYQMVDKLSSKVNGMPCGLYIASVADDSGLSGKAAKGDIITHINGTEVTSSSVVLSVLENTEAGKDVELTIYYASSKTSGTVTVKLAEDRGSSNYNAETKTAEQDQPSEFSFPFGD